MKESLRQSILKGAEYNSLNNGSVMMTSLHALGLLVMLSRRKNMGEDLVFTIHGYYGGKFREVADECAADFGYPHLIYEGTGVSDGCKYKEAIYAASPKA